MSDPVQLEDKSGKSKSSKQSKKSSQKQNAESNNDEKQNNFNDNQQMSSQPVLSTRAYLEQNVTPVVQEALLECARKRPSNPLEFVGNYILERARK